MKLPKINLSRFFIWLGVLLILVLSLYLRFYQVENVFSFGWDQGRDAFAVREILQGKLVLEGPQAGGQFHLGPVYYYLLAPFFLLTNYDPVGAVYFNILAYVFNFLVVYYVFYKINGRKFALLAGFLYAFCRYWINGAQVPWNVSLVPGVATLIFYFYYQVISRRINYLPLLAFFTGLFFHFHFTAIFLSIIFLPILFFLPKTKVSLKYILISIPLFVVWFVPNIINTFYSSHIEAFRYSDFLKNYFIGFHFRFLLHRLPDSLIEFQPFVSYSPLDNLKYIYPLIFLVLTIWQKNKDNIHQAVVSISWLLGPLIGFTLYGGPISDYYFYLTLPAVLLIFLKVNIKLVSLFPGKLTLVIACLWLIYFFQKNTSGLWQKPLIGGLNSQKLSVKEAITNDVVIPYHENEIRSYLYMIWTEKK